MQIDNSLRRKKQDELVIKSLLWKIVIDVFQEKKSLDITESLVSVTLKGSTFFVKTGKSLLNYELLQIKDIILESLETKMKKLGIKLKEVDIKFV